MPYEKVGDNEPVCIADEVPFEIPDGWEWCRLAFANEIYTGNSINENVKKQKYTNLKEGYNYISTKDVGFNNEIAYDNGIKIPFNENNFKIADKNSVLLCIEGGSAGRKIAFLKEDVCFGNKLCCFKQYCINEKFLYYYLQSNLFTDVFKENTTGIIGGVSVNTIKSLFLPLPPYQEQQRIVTEIEKYLPLINEYDKLQTELDTLDKEFPEKLKKSILQQAIQGKLVEQDSSDEPASILLEKIRKEKEKLIKEGKIKKDKNESIIYKRDNSYYEKLNGVEKCIDDEIPFEIPESWEWCRFNSIVNYHMGKTPPRKDSKYWDNAKHNWISISDMIPNGIISGTKEKVNDYSVEKIFKNQITKKGTLIMSFKLTVGRVSILDIDAYHNEAIISIYPYNNANNVITNFLFTFLPLLTTFGDAKTAIKGNTLNSSSINNLLIPLPPIIEQNKIIVIVNQLFSCIDNYCIHK